MRNFFLTLQSLCNKKTIAISRGHVINGFKTGTRKAAKELGLLSQGYQAEAKPQQTEPITLSCPSSKVQYAEVEPQPKHSPIGTLWEPGYNDRLLLHKNQLAHMLAYLDDNPRRLLLKRQHPEFFSPLGTITLAGTNFQAMGNLALLSCKKKLALQCSRHLYQQEIDQLALPFSMAEREDYQHAPALSLSE